MELPLRVLVSAVVVGLTVPAILSGLSAYEAGQISVRVEQGIDVIVRAAEDFYLAGGGAQTIRVDLDGGATIHVEYVLLGDAAGGPRATTASYKLTGQPVVFIRSNPPVPMEGEEGPLRLGPGRHTVRVSFEGEGPVRLAVIA